jgi:uncharacterized protein YdeI (YjbR/CyaY-like superfamily)
MFVLVRVRRLIETNLTMPKRFKTRRDFRAWLSKNHDKERELVLRLFKKHALHRGIGYRDALDEALCWGWIDGVVKRLDEDSFQQRYSPRKPKSNWSTVNIKRMKELIAAGRVAKSGLEAFERREKTRPAPYSYENRDRITLDAAFVQRFKAEPKAWAFFERLPPGYRRLMIFRVMDAKKEETRERRFAQLLEMCRKEKRMELM